MFAGAPQECAERGQTIGEASEPEELLLQDVGQARRSPWRAAGGAAAGLLLLAGAGAGAAHLSLRGAASGADRLQSKEQTIAFPSREQCSNWTDDCYSTGCCSVAGLTCFETKPGKAECLKNCTPSATKLCTQTQALMEPVLADAALYDPTLYCFAIVMQDIGSTKKYYDLELLQMAYEKQTSIFGCDSWGVFSDAEADLAPGVPVTKVDDVDGDFPFREARGDRHLAEHRPALPGLGGHSGGGRVRDSKLGREARC